MRTFKRNTPDIDTDLDNYNKYFNQMEFKGITEDDNIYAIDQESFKDCKNVYVNFHERLASRPTLQKDNSLPDNIKELLDVYRYNLINIYSIGIGKIYVIQNPANKLYSVIIVNDNIEVLDDTVLALEELPKYEIAIIEHYVICFNNKVGLGAQVYDTNNPNKGWSSLKNYVDIPVVKRVVGSTETTYDKNGFTDSYKEEYIWSNESKPTLPSGNAEVTVNSASNKYINTYLNKDISKATDYRIIKPVNADWSNRNYINRPIISIAKNRICIAYDNYFKLSTDGGNTFITNYYPLYEGDFLRIASISEDGLYFFFVASYGVYRCNLGDYTWAAIDRVTLEDNNTTENIIGTPASEHNNCCKFLTGDTYCFITTTLDTTAQGNYKYTLYFKGPGLFLGTDSTKDKLLRKVTQLNNPTSSSDNYVDLNTLITIPWRNLDCNRKHKCINIYIDSSGNAVISIVLPKYSEASETNKSQMRWIYIRPYKSVDTKMAILQTLLPDEWNTEMMTIGLLSGTDVNVNKGLGSIYTIVRGKHTGDSSINVNTWMLSNLSVKFYITDTPESLRFEYDDIETIIYDGTYYNGFVSQNIYGTYNIPSVLSNGYAFGSRVQDNQGKAEADELKEDINWVDIIHTVNNTVISIAELFTDGNTLYFIGNKYGTTSSDNINTIYTNNLADTDIASIVYTYTANTKFLKVPNVTYSDTELYLAFDNLLQITANNKEGTDIKFNLPKINDQSFISQITGMINISTTEVALFFKDKITICSKVTDENLASGYRYDYYNTKLSTGIRLGDTPINTLEGSYTLFPTLRGLAAMNYQAFMATTDQTLQYLTDKIKHLWEAFYNNSTVIKIIQWRTKLILTNGTGIILLFDINDNTWWKWEVPVNTEIALTNQIDLSLITISPGMLTIFKDQREVVQKDSNGNIIFDDNTGRPATKLIPQYYDFSEIGPGITIDWNVLSQPLHMKAPNYYKNLKQLVFQFYEDSENRTQKTMNAQIKLYRKNITLRAPETIQFTIENLRTFVKRFNYWKINEVQWGLGNDADTSTPKPFEINGISVKYEIGEEVR